MVRLVDNSLLGLLDIKIVGRPTDYLSPYIATKNFNLDLT